MREVGKVNSPTAEGYYLSNGHANPAILKFKYDDSATTTGGALWYTGLHHFGVEIENMEEAQERIKKRVRFTDPTRDRRDGEAWQRRGEIHWAGRRDDRPIRARLARHQVKSRFPSGFLSA